MVGKKIRAFREFRGYSQIICLDVIAFSALLNDSMATYSSSHSAQFPFFLGSI